MYIELSILIMVIPTHDRALSNFSHLQNEALVIVGIAVGVDWNPTDDGEGLVGLVDGAAVLEAFRLP